MSLLFHYTTGDALLGILRYSSVRATEINFLNDFTEFQHGITTVRELCKKNAESTNQFGIIGTQLSSLYQMIPEIIRANVSRRQVFVFSLTQKRDNLRQWMAYGKPNSSYCIGFEDSDLADLGEKFNEKLGEEFVYRLRAVSYGSSEVLKRTLNPVGLVEKISAGRSVPDLALELINELMFECCSIKREEFHDEGETRLIVQTRTPSEINRHVEYRERGGIVIPYLDVPFPITAVREVVIGPMVHSAMAKNGLSQLMASRGLFKSEINESTCALRHF